MNEHDNMEVEVSHDLEANDRNNNVMNIEYKAGDNNSDPIVSSSSSGNGNVIISLCDYAIKTYGPSFSNLVYSIIPFLQQENNISKREDYKNTILNNIDIELGYSRKELEMMNAPLLEFINSSSSPYGQENNRKDNENHISQRINSALEHFYEELEEDYTIY